MMYGVEKEKIPVKKNWEIGTCRSIDYPKFSNFQPITKFEDYGKKEKKFSGFIAYRNQMELSKDQDRRYILFIPEAGEDVEFFVNGTSQGIQILPPFYMILRRQYRMERMTSELKWQLRWNGNVERIRKTGTD